MFYSLSDNLNHSIAFTIDTPLIFRTNKILKFKNWEARFNFMTQAKKVGGAKTHQKFCFWYENARKTSIFTWIKFSFIVSNNVWNFGFLDLIIDRIMTVTWQMAMEADATFLIQNRIMKCQWWLWFILVAILVQNRMLVLNMYYVLLRL